MRVPPGCSVGSKCPVMGACKEVLFGLLLFSHKYSPREQNPQSEGQIPGQGIVPEPAVDGFLDQVWERKVGGEGDSSKI